VLINCNLNAGIDHVRATKKAAFIRPL